MKTYSPILAGRLAVSTTDGLPRVLEAITLAVTVSERQRKLTTVDTAAQRVQSLRKAVADKRHVETLLRSERGVELVVASMNTLFGTIETVLSTDQTPTAPIQFGFSKHHSNTMYVNTIHGMHLGLHATNVCSNSVGSTRLEVKIFRRHWNLVGQATSDVIPIHDSEFQPSFRVGDQVVWISADDFAVYDAEQLAAHVVDLFVEHVHREIDEAADRE